MLRLTNASRAKKKKKKVPPVLAEDQSSDAHTPGDLVPSSGLPKHLLTGGKHSYGQTHMQKIKLN